MHKLLFAVIWLIVGSFVAFAAMATPNYPIDYSTKEKILITPKVCKVYYDTMNLALKNYAVNVPYLEIAEALDKGILENMVDDEEYAGRAMASENLSVATDVVRNDSLFTTPTIVTRMDAADRIVADVYQHCRQIVGETRGVFARRK
jgi:hypothetical protein